MLQMLCMCISSEKFVFFSSGSKTADPYCYGHTQFHLLPDKFKRERLLKKNCADQIEVVFRANAIASLFAWTGAQAMYQGNTNFITLLFLEDVYDILRIQ